MTWSGPVTAGPIVTGSFGSPGGLSDKAPTLPRCRCLQFMRHLHSCLTQSPRCACQVGSAPFHSRFRDEGPREVKATHLKSNMGCLSTIPGRANTLPFATLPYFLARYRHHESITGLFPPPAAGRRSALQRLQAAHAQLPAHLPAVRAGPRTSPGHQGSAASPRPQIGRGRGVVDPRGSRFPRGCGPGIQTCPKVRTLGLRLGAGRSPLGIRKSDRKSRFCV